MAKRRIKDAKDLTTGELIYFRSHAKATYLSDGSTLEEKISNIEKNTGIGVGIISITYSDLVDLRNNSKLNPGTKYRITDYITTTSQENTQSAGHQFDIIVEALSEDTLSEDAKAIQNENDRYFDESNLEAWELKYCLDNDTSKFAWTDVNGKGVIYYMKDEFNNECPYDFKNIKFYREEQDNRYLFTFSWVNENEDVEDLTLRQDLLSDDGTAYGTHDNIIKTYYNENRQQLNDVTFVSSYLYDSGLFYGCFSNSFGNECYSNSFGDNCYSNSLGDGCYLNNFGNGCHSNSFGNDCFSNSFGNECYSNSFGNGCHSNSFGNECFSNSLGNGCNKIKFTFRATELAPNIRNNQLGNSCSNLNIDVLYSDNNEYLQNFVISSGLVNASISLTDFEYYNRDYETCIARNSKGEIKIYCEADLIG